MDALLDVAASMSTGGPPGGQEELSGSEGGPVATGTWHQKAPASELTFVEC